MKLTKTQVREAAKVAQVDLDSPEIKVILDMGDASYVRNRARELLADQSNKKVDLAMQLLTIYTAMGKASGNPHGTKKAKVSPKARNKASGSDSKGTPESGVVLPRDSR